jgi:hypothetical protein
VKLETPEPPNNAFEPTPLRVEQDHSDFGMQMRLSAFPIYRCGAAQY